jgi:cyclase
MTSSDIARPLSRRALLRGGVAFTGAAFFAPHIPSLLGPSSAAMRQQAAPAGDLLAQSRASMANVPIEVIKLTDRLTMLSGPGGNVVVLPGSDGKVVVDTFVQSVWQKLAETLNGLSKDPVKVVIDTHWHFDHSDNNGAFQKIGAAILAHENTKTRMAQSHSLLGMNIPASPPEALPTQTFKTTHSLTLNGEQIALSYVPPAHTDTDVYIHFTKGNVLHLGDLYFNGSYPFIDASTGGKINGMIAAADTGLELANATTKIVPGHGPLGDRGTLTKYRDMLSTVRDRVQKLKASGQSLDQVVAANPTAEFDAAWGKGFMDPKRFVGFVYETL